MRAADRRRRLRHGVLIVVLPEQFPDRHHQTRQVVRRTSSSAGSAIGLVRRTVSPPLGLAQAAASEATGGVFPGLSIERPDLNARQVLCYEAAAVGQPEPAVE